MTFKFDFVARLNSNFWHMCEGCKVGPYTRKCFVKIYQLIFGLIVVLKPRSIITSSTFRRLKLSPKYIQRVRRIKSGWKL
jgi:hypothetical protein